MSLKNFPRSEGVYMYRFPLCVPSVSPSKIHNTVTLSIKEKKKISYRSFKHSLMNLNSNDMIEVA